MADGTPVNGQLGGFAELIVAWEEMVVPIFTKHDSAALSNLSCVAMTGLGMTMLRTPVEPGSSVVIFGAGPIGLSAVQGAKLQGASTIVVVEPIRYRRELATKLGATAVVDPNAVGDGNACSPGCAPSRPSQPIGRSPAGAGPMPRDRTS